MAVGAGFKSAMQASDVFAAARLASTSRPTTRITLRVRTLVIVDVGTAVVVLKIVSVSKRVMVVRSVVTVDAVVVVEVVVVVDVVSVVDPVVVVETDLVA
jgi:hypothetical protein